MAFLLGDDMNVLTKHQYPLCNVILLNIHCQFHFLLHVIIYQVSKILSGVGFYSNWTEHVPRYQGVVITYNRI